MGCCHSGSLNLVLRARQDFYTISLSGWQLLPSLARTSKTYRGCEDIGICSFQDLPSMFVMIKGCEEFVKAKAAMKQEVWPLAGAGLWLV